MAKKNSKGLTVSKEENISEWYTQVIQKADLADYSLVSGCIVFKPNSYQVWEKIQSILDLNLKKSNHKNVYFPLFIPEKLLMKEAKHVEGFSPEVAWVTHAGDSKLEERLAIRPTSETIMYDSYSKWVRSYRDLPLLYNQWCSVVRWEFAHAKPFLRTREFLWQEGHTVHVDREDSLKEAKLILGFYKELMEEYLAIPVLAGEKTNNERFAGADTTFTLEALMPDGKALQMGTSHMLGQNFSKAFDIKFLDKDKQEKFAWQNSWGVSTRLIGAIILVHGDNKGFVLPPKIAVNKAVIVPIFNDESKKKVLSEAKKLEKKLVNFNTLLDERDNYSPGWKFNEWEMKGIPLRIELGPKDLEKNQVVLVRRDNGKKFEVKITDVEKQVEKLLEEIQISLFENAKKFLKENIVEGSTKKEFIDAIKNKKMFLGHFCLNDECEKKVKEETSATARLISDKNEKEGKCFYCGEKANKKVYFAKAY